MAIEPHPQLAGNLERLFGAGHGSCLRAVGPPRPTTVFLPVFQGAQLDARGLLDLRANDGYLLQQIEVEATTLHSLALQDVAAMKIDVEGHERAVLDTGYFFWRKTPWPLALFDAARHQSEALVKRPRGPQSRDYAKNFLFVSRDTPAAVSRLVARGFLQS